MKIVITKYPFFREDFTPTPCDNEKAVYVGLILESTGFAPEESIQAHIPFPGGAYQVPIYTLLGELVKVSEEWKPNVISRWIPYLNRSEEERKKGWIVTIPIAADCCEVMTTTN